MCEDIILELAFIGKSIKKSHVAIVVVLCDILICISYLVSLYILEVFERHDTKMLSQSTIKIEDFTVEIQGIPKRSEYKTLENLKAHLWNLLEKVADEEE